MPLLRTVCRLSLFLLVSAAGFSSAQAQQKLTIPKPEADEIYDTVGQPAVPVGGVEAYAQYLADNQRYPTAALQRRVQGTAPVTFVVEKSGVISNVAVTPPLDPALDQEAVRLIKGGPKWTPAQHRGAKVRQRVTVPIAFAIPADESGTSAATAPAGPGSSSGPTLVKPDEPARPVGGTEAFFTWIQENQKYPTLARQRKIQGRVMMEFVVEKDGSLVEPKIIKRLGSGLDEEALRLIKTAPKWTPARYKGQPMKQKMVLPVVFQL
ncbi:TonB family protein [Hymenobacter roseosalivarius DSM 11622]|uniref:TonB family protein n=1 Tax=Hymenobacter roseosalivarius DSM 11622 TaxID=645990 RepID=A0A1W1VT59_9BACT|nr:energy transducer TonB [Hymenobacter roseosalivarius]SMB96539.1 TonB family protein [Hymenobacter roseosalivarius DSM 11622]